MCLKNYEKASQNIQAGKCMKFRWPLTHTPPHTHTPRVILRVPILPCAQVNDMKMGGNETPLTGVRTACLLEGVLVDGGGRPWEPRPVLGVGEVGAREGGAQGAKDARTKSKFGNRKCGKRSTLKSMLKTVWHVLLKV